MKEQPWEYPEIIPCPRCRHEHVIKHLGIHTVRMECLSCGHSIGAAGEAATLVKREEVPAGLPFYERILLRLKGTDGRPVEWPHHGYVGIHAVRALQHAGCIERWNNQ